MADKTELNRLPKTWIWTTLGELGVVVSGGTPATDEPQYWGGDVAWITPADLSNYTEKYISQGRRNISIVGLENSSAVLLPENSLIFSSRAPIGYIVINKNKLATNQGFKNLIPTTSGYVDYLFYYLQSAKQIATALASGTTFLELSAANFSKIPVPLAPIDEQKRIVYKIEELFTELQGANDNLLNSQKRLEGYRYQCLKEAFGGRITNKMHTSNENKPTGHAGANPSLLPQGWQWGKVQDVAKVIMGQSPKGSSYNKKGIGVPLINGPVEFGPTAFSYTLKEKWTTEPKKMCERGDLILCVRGSTTGRQNIAGFAACLGRGVAAIRGLSVDQHFLYYYFYFSSKKIFDMGTGTTFPNVSLDQLLNLPIPIVPIDEQRQIVQEIEYRFTIADNLKKTITTNLQRIEIYRQTVLKKAFSGNLVAQVLEDESAQELLKRICVERIALLSEIAQQKKANPPKKLMKKPLIEILQEAFNEKEFTYEQLNDVIGLSYEDIKSQLFKLLESQKQIKSSFNSEKGRITFKLIK